MFPTFNYRQVLEYTGTGIGLSQSSPVFISVVVVPRSSKQELARNCHSLVETQNNVHVNVNNHNNVPYECSIEYTG